MPGGLDVSEQDIVLDNPMSVDSVKVEKVLQAFTDVDHG